MSLTKVGCAAGQRRVWLTGNAPNLLVKTIAEHAGVPTPSFVGYIWKFALPILFPPLVVISILFFS